MSAFKKCQALFAAHSSFLGRLNKRNCALVNSSFSKRVNKKKREEPQVMENVSDRGGCFGKRRLRAAPNNHCRNLFKLF